MWKFVWSLLLSYRNSNDAMDTENNGDGEDVDEMQVEKKPHDPNDLSIYNLDDYDDEPSKGSGAFSKLNGLQHPDALENDQYVTLDDVRITEQEIFFFCLYYIFHF